MKLKLQCYIHNIKLFKVTSCDIDTSGKSVNVRKTSSVETAII